MIVQVVNELEKALKLATVESHNALHESIAMAIGSPELVWRKEYTIAVAKDDSKRKIANFMVCNKLDETEQTFKVKREKDFWKKLEPRDDYEAVVECSLFPLVTDLATIETMGRDIMRSRKEVPSVANKGFVWLVGVDFEQNLDELFELYFKENYRTVTTESFKYYIGWTENLKSLDMRNFICTPKAKKALK